MANAAILFSVEFVLHRAVNTTGDEKEERGDRKKSLVLALLKAAFVYNACHQPVSR